eukprot:SM000123S25829  [mRNA]  locus=s123:125721:128260:+ [translate_table: standard]
MHIKSKLASMAGIPPTKELLHYEDVRSDGASVMCESLDKKLGDGDIVCMKRPPAAMRKRLKSLYQPKLQPVKYRGIERLLDMLVYNKQTSDILYFEPFDLPLPELQGLKMLKDSSYNICLPKESIVGDILAELRTKGTDYVLLVVRKFPHTEKFDKINDKYWTPRAEEVPDEERDIGPNDRLIHVNYFTRDATQVHVVQYFGEPFFLVAHENETAAESLEACLLSGYPEYLIDTDVVVTRFQMKETYWAWEHFLGSEHADTNPKRSHESKSGRSSRHLISSYPAL